MNLIRKTICFMTLVVFMSCGDTTKNQKEFKEERKGKKVVYQVFTRLFGNTNTSNKPWGTIEENGVGKFDDFTDLALTEIKKLGVTHIWYTGVLHHAMIADYTAYGISNDDPDVVKGRAGSPYAVKDYYNVNPDLAVHPENRLLEFENLIARTHKAGLKVIIDIVPNHIARGYEGKTNPEGVVDFGADDDTSVAYARHNNFYYVVNENFKVPVSQNNYKPLGGEKNSLSDNSFDESPAKWTGNGSRLAQPNFNDWYETVKINYGIKPDGSKDFSELPQDFLTKEYKDHYEFWKDKEIPNSWNKFRDITSYWLDKGVDGFRYDMAEMVPVEFWSYLNSSVKKKNPDAFILAEVYNPALYRAYIHLGKMDYLYDKVALYDTIKHIVRGHGSTDNIPKILEDLKDIESHMLHFLENHDEQRFASPEFGGDAEKAKPAMAVSAMTTTAPTMVYFGQEVGEKGADNAGFGTASRTSIFDYVGVPAHQRWMNKGAFDGGQLSEKESHLRDFYVRLLNFTITSEALEGAYYDTHAYNRTHTENYTNKVFSFVRANENEKLLILANFDAENSYEFEFFLSEKLLNELKLQKAEYLLEEQLYKQHHLTLGISEGQGKVKINLERLGVYVFKIQ